MTDPLGCFKISAQSFGDSLYALYFDADGFTLTYVQRLTVASYEHGWLLTGETMPETVNGYMRLSELNVADAGMEFLGLSPYACELWTPIFQ